MGWSDLKQDLQRFLEWADVSVNCAETESAMQHDAARPNMDTSGSRRTGSLEWTLSKLCESASPQRTYIVRMMS